MAEDLGERTEAPTGRRISEARGMGRVAKSADLAAAIDLIGSVLLIVLLGAGVFKGLGVLMRRVLDVPGAFDASDLAGSIELAKVALFRGALVLVPLMLLAAAISFLSHFVQIGWLFTTKPATPDISRLNPVGGFAKLFSTRNAVRSAVNSVKLAVVIAVGWLYLRGKVGGLAALPLLDIQASMLLIGKLAIELAAWLLLVLLIIGLADFAYQKWQHTKDLRMTRQEVQDERRSMDGDPKLKGKRLQMMREMALQRVRQAVPEADVIVTNPEHFAVAIKYDAETMHAPRLVAKGVDFMAARIRQVAMIHGVPIVERPPLARAIYWGLKVGDEIPPQHYQAVAEILAYVYRMEKQAA